MTGQPMSGASWGEPRAGQPAHRLSVCVLVDRHPVLSESFVRTEVRALRAAGHDVHIEAIAQGEEIDEPPLPASTRALDPTSVRVRALVELVARHPLRCLHDLRARGRWRREEPPVPLRELAPVACRIRRRGERHLHAHFAAGAALDAQRLGAVLGLPHSITAHAHDIFLAPRNLREKVDRAAFTTTGCAYNVEHLRRVAPEAAGRIHEIVMGVDTAVWRRSRPLPQGRTVVAVGRLVEKKGFAHLLRAAARLQPAAERLIVVGEGPERARLEALAAPLAARTEVRFTGALAAGPLRATLEQADVLAMPSVVAADGDRDSMPVVVKEAMALEMLVAASDAVGLPEAVAAPWGRLAAPGDEAGLARALGELLALGAQGRMEAGRAAREWVLAHADAGAEAQRLARLIEHAAR